ncbi:MAG: hypothetical protein HY294_07505 [Candidatus Rokubacteria bacterium]|nr:hypothetical protein [Candidatus Rokubacteria bacterium]MBI3825824.1 hypothetical protein [Candidatus Rokubacteria bacterium]
MNLHRFLPLMACGLNLGLAAITLTRHPQSRLTRIFAAFVSAAATWSFSVFLLRAAPDESMAMTLEVFAYASVAVIPPLFVHFVRVFLEQPARHPLLVAGYVAAGLFGALAFARSPLFLRGVEWTSWGWIPTPGPLYPLFFAYFNGLVAAGLVWLVLAYPGLGSSFRRNRVILLVSGTTLSLVGAAVDFLRPLLVGQVPWADELYPIGIPANIVLALCAGASIVRYRMFDVGLTAKKTAIVLVGGLLLSVFLVFLSVSVGTIFRAYDVDPLWVVVPLGLVLLLGVGPTARWVEDFIERFVFAWRRACYDTLLALSKRMATMVDLTTLTETLVHGLVTGIPVTCCALLTRDETLGAFVPYRVEGGVGTPRPIALDGAVARCVVLVEDTFVPSEARLDPRTSPWAEACAAELAGWDAAIIAPLRSEAGVSALLLVGEKLSGEIFSVPELEVLGLLGRQAAIALENAHLYDDLRRQMIELRETQDQLVQSAKLAAIGELAAGVAHEINNPLTAVLGFAAYLEERAAADDPMRESLRLIRDEASRARDIVRDLLHFSRQREFAPEPASLNDVVRDTVRMLRRNGALDTVQVVEDYVEGSALVNIDISRMTQVFLNILTNAAQATPEGGTITIRTITDEAGAAAEFSDTGAGIRPEHLPRIFDPFFTTKPAGSTGLGLSVSHAITQRHGATIDVASVVGKGSTFSVRLPWRSTACAVTTS